MEIFLVRHTTVNVSKSICYGQMDVGLAASFEAEKTVILDKINEKWADTDGTSRNNREEVAVWSSPLSRCQKLAEFLGQNLNTTVQTDANLQELNFGDWEAKAWNDLPPAELQTWMSDFVFVKTPNGECYHDLHQRTTLFIERLFEKDVKKAIIVTHAGNIRSFISYALDLSLEHSFRLHLNYGAMASVIIEKQKTTNKLLFLI